MSDRDIFIDKGEMRARLAAHRPAPIPLLEAVPPTKALKVAFDLMLDSPLPASIVLGDDYEVFYNDAYRALLGDKHPAALGQPFLQMWPDAPSELKGALAQAFLGESSALDDIRFSVLRDGQPDQVWLTCAFSAIRDENGLVVGVFATWVETKTESKARVLEIAERRQAFQLNLADRLRPLLEPDEITAAASELLGQELQVSRVLYAEVDDAKKIFTVRRDWVTKGMASIAGKVARLDDFGPDLIATLRNGESVVVSDVACDERTAVHVQAYADIGVTAFLVIPLIKSGRLTALLSLHEKGVREWSDIEMIFSQDMIERTWASAENARAQAELRAERDQSQHIFNSMFEGFSLLDCNWHVLQMNAEGLRIGQREAAEVIGRNLWEIWPEAVGTKLEALYRQVKATGVPDSVEYEQAFPQGNKIWLEVRCYPALDGGLANFFRDITERKNTEVALLDAEASARDSHGDLKLLLDSTGEGFYAVDRTGTTTMCNAAFVSMLGFERAEDAIGKKLHGLIHHTHPDGKHYERDDCPIYIAADRGIPAHVVDELFFRLDGSSFPVEYSVHPIWKNNELQGALCTFVDTSERKRAQASLLASEQRFRSLFEQHTDAILMCDLNGNYTACNDMMLELTGYTEAQLYSMKIGDLTPVEEADLPRAHFRDAITGTSQKFKNRVRRKDGRVIEVDETFIPIVVENEVIGVYLIVRDITASSNYERRIEYLASHDVLTALPNRNLLDDRLSHAIQQRGDRQLGVMFLDLNRFKVVNDSLGHDKGDILLKIVAQRMRAVLRPGDTIARLGGDEFVVLLEEVTSVEQIALAAEDLLQVVEKPINLDSHEVNISTSIGISVYPKDGDNAHMLLKHADVAMYQAKELGSGTFRFFDPEMNVKALERLLTESGLRRAMERNEFVIHYQPRIDALTGVTVGIEALVRWQHPERGLIAPSDFIPLAEEIGLIGAIGEWVLSAACHQNRAWQDAGLPQAKIAVNLSPHQLLSPTFADTLQQVLDDSGLDARWLELEITETSLMQYVDAVLHTLSRIRAMGVSMSIDDFGTGYSSLSYLKRLPVDTLKIDKSFIRDVTDDPDDATIVAATITLAHNMGLHVVAEGVTTVEQARFLVENHCTTMQGYLFGRPLPVAELETFLRAAPLVLDGIAATS